MESLEVHGFNNEKIKNRLSIMSSLSNSSDSTASSSSSVDSNPLSSSFVKRIMKRSMSSTLFSSSSSMIFSNPSRNSQPEKLFSSGVENDIKEDKNCRYFTRNALFLREEAERAISNARAMRSSIHLPSLDSIPETQHVDSPIEKREAKIVIFLDGFDDTCDPEAISLSIHQAITSHVKFTCMKNVPSILKEAYASVSRKLTTTCTISCTTLIIYKDEVCMAHVGDTRAIIVAPNEMPYQLTQEHMNVASREVTNHLGKPRCEPDLFHFQVMEQQGKSTRPKSLFSKISTRASSDEKSVPTFLVIANSPVWDSMANPKVAEYVSKSLAKKKRSPEEISKKLIKKHVNPRMSRHLDAEALIITF